MTETVTGDVAPQETGKNRSRRSVDPDVKRQRLNPLDGDVDGVSITFDGNSSYAVRFGYNPDLVAQIRAIPGAAFDGNDAWRVPVAQYDALAEVSASMRKEYLLDVAAHDGIVSLAQQAARERQDTAEVQPRLSEFHPRDEALRGEIISVNDRYAAQLTGNGRRDGVAFVTLHRLADLSEAVLKGDKVSITYDEKGRAKVGQLLTVEEKLDASLGKSVDGVKVTQEGGQYRIEFDYNPALADRIARIDGADFKRDEKIWVTDANLKSFVARAVNDMRKEVVADRADRDQMMEVAAELIDSPKTHDAFTADGKGYSGRVLAINDRYVLQHSGKDHVTLHRARSFEELPAAGQNARISYKQGKAQVNEQSHERERNQGVAR
ncbi:KfrB domain-containing protein [Paraburkholderia sacchari]|uniref:KfrB domain-containing protein n=1 Tax=Paraburkholderia sacchari TaxID=159450 RepID=A0A8T6ZK80_9BURK|nr:hypothetical protein [Paraburkholderia sacchari]NLP65512.1 hypothetical protein [Paraburkholderia sacchari]NLP65597.1 hypothetical protein [Paraburkholderia sacchari]